MRMWSRASVFNVLPGAALDRMGRPQIRSGVDSAGRVQSCLWETATLPVASRNDS